MERPKMLQDLGVIKKDGAVRGYRFGLFECLECKKPFEAIINNVKNGVTKKCTECRSQPIGKLDNIPRMIEDLGMVKKEGTTHTYKYGIFECPQCHNSFEARISNVKSGLTKKCQDCRKPKQKIVKKKLPTVSYDKNDDYVDGIYKDMIKKCYFKNHKEFSIYGGVGVTVCDEFLNDKQAFRRIYPSLFSRKKPTIATHEKEFSPKTIMFADAKEYKEIQKIREQVLSFEDGIGVIYDIKKECYMAYKNYQFIADTKNPHLFLTK